MHHRGRGSGPSSSVSSLSDECQDEIRTPSTVLVPVTALAALIPLAPLCTLPSVGAGLCALSLSLSLSRSLTRASSADSREERNGSG